MFLPDELLFLAPEHAASSGTLNGGFARRIYVLALAEPDFPGNRAFLSKVLSSVQLNLDKDTLFAEIPESMQLSFIAELKNKQPEHILVFGLSPAQLGFHFEPTFYQPFVFYNFTWIFADALSVLEPDKNRKGQLWVALKQLFL